MTQENKELLLKDLSARLPYHVKCKIWLKVGTTEEGFLDLEHNYADVLRDAFYYNEIKDIKPYLRPMSSMTDEERNEYGECTMRICNIKNGERLYIPDYNTLDWLNAHHFDYRNLIKRGLAIEAPANMYKID